MKKKPSKNKMWGGRFTSKPSDLLQKVKDEIDPIAKVELNPKFEGRQMIMVLAPR